MAGIQDKEIQQYRDLVPVPDEFEEAFGPKMIVAALFLGVIMVPGSIYLTLFMGAGLGPAAQWVTVILFAEVAKRSMKSLRKQEIFLLYYMTGIALSGQLQGGILSQLLWNQYLVQSGPAQSMGIAADIPWWVAPPGEVLAEAPRTFFTAGWVDPILFMVGMMVLSRIDQFGLGYALYRITSHIEKLPFPMAPVGAMGITALAETRGDQQQWRWRCFSLGGVLGLGFGLIYVGVPAITGSFLNRPVEIIPIPWLDLTPELSRADFMPATPLNLVFDAGLIILGMVLPFWAVVGGFVAMVGMLILNPLLYRAGVLTGWTPGMNVVHTQFQNTLDFYLSFSMGLMLAIFLMSLLPVVRLIWRRFVRQAGPPKLGAEPEVRRPWWRIFVDRDRNRGDFAIVTALGIYACSTLTYITISSLLMPGTPELNYQDKFPWHFFLAFAFIYQPAINYINAKLEGIVGQTVQIPMVQEAAFILSGYKGAAIWFAPIPVFNDYAGAVRNFRVLELTGTRLRSIIKIELLALPILAVSSLLFSEMIWRMAPIPSETYPFTQEVWELQALNFSLRVTATAEGSSRFIEALNANVIGSGLIAGIIAFALLSFLNLPTFLIYGAVRGFGQVTPGHALPEMVGALIGRFYLERKFGRENFKRYIMVVMAGFAAGVGLVAMGSVAIAFIAKSTTTLGY